MADVTVVVDRAAIAELLVSPTGPVAQDLTRRALKVNNRAKQLAPVDTGRLRASISWQMERGAMSLSAIIGTNVTYARYIEFGHGVITPKRARLLSWVGRDGKRHFAKAVRAQPPRPFLRPALDAAR